MWKRTLRDIDLINKNVLVRVDFNVTLDKGNITDDSRIRSVIPTIKYLQEQNARIILCSHLGRPDGMVIDEMKLKPIAARLSEILEMPVISTEDCIGTDTRAMVSALQPRGVALLENLRFHAEEEGNDPEFAKELASLADVFVNDGFAVAHRAHASTEGVTHHLPSVAGLLMEKELEILGTLLKSPQPPVAVILGGAKVSDKIAVIESFIDKADTILIGGGMAATFIKANGYSVGNSSVENERLNFTMEIMARAKDKGVSLLIPNDVIVGDTFSASAQPRTVRINNIPDGSLIMDIGHRTLDTYQASLAKTKTILWNGPMGVFEFPAFSRGTREIANTLASLTGSTTVVGGGSTAEIVDSLGIAERITHVSTGGGASLEFLEGKNLPGVAALLDEEDSKQ